MNMAPFDVRARGRTASADLTLRVDPAAGALIKREDRTVVWRQPLPDGTPAVWKLYRRQHPTWVQRMGLYTGRARREFMALCRAEEAGVPCSRPLFFAEGFSAEAGHYALLVTGEVERGIDLRTRLKSPEGLSMQDWKPLFQMVAALHRARLQHGALQDRNILLSDGRFYLIDFPRCQRFGASIHGRRPGWFDLTTLLCSLTGPVPREVLLEGLKAYGPLPTPAAAFLATTGADTHGNRWRNFMHAVFTAWGFLSRLRAGIARLFQAARPRDCQKTPDLP